MNDAQRRLGYMTGMVGMVAVCLIGTMFGVTQAASWPFSLLYQFDGTTYFEWQGYPVGPAGDVNDDGTVDFIVGAWRSPNLTNVGSVFVYSGADGTLLYRKDGEAAEDSFGYSVAGACDVNDDGFADFIIGAPGADPGGREGAGSAHVYSGMDGSLLYRKDGVSAGDRLGSSVALGGGSPGGWRDFIIGAPGADPDGREDAGSVYVYSARDGALLLQKDGEEWRDWLGLGVAYLGDLNKDGVAEFIVAAPLADPDGRSDAGSVYVYDGNDGSLLFQKDGGFSGDHLGYESVACAGDVDWDGVPEFMIGVFDAAYGGRTSPGSVYMYSGRDGSLMYQTDGPFGAENLGYYAVAGAGDVNGDRHADFIIGAWDASPGGLTNAGAVYVYSGLDGSLMYQTYGSEGDVGLGMSVNAAGDVNEDGLVDVIIGLPGANPGGVSSAGSVYVLQSGYMERIEQVADIGNDQGRRVRIQWKSLPGNDDFVKNFAIYRRIGPYQSGVTANDPFHLDNMPPGNWDFVVSVPAHGDTLYSTEVPTDADSTVVEGMYWSVFFVSAIGDNPTDHFDSPPDSGYSKDNLVPAPPTALIAAVVGSTVTLDWRAIGDADFEYYWVYRDTTAEFALSPSKRIGSTSDTAFLDNAVPQASAVHYRVAAVDFSGNEGLPSNEASVSLCACDCHADPLCDGIRNNVQDVVLTVNVAFRGAAAMPDPNNACPDEVTDTNCSGTTDVVDVVKIVNVAFRGANPAMEFCDPCP